MPVSHLGLTVPHIPSATSFYLSCLQPLGYRYIGSRGDSIGLGVHDADFFLTQEKHGYRSAPTHIAFSAADRAAVRDCYAAALNAGGRPNGSPSYREDDCNCFNAAVEDLDGNTVEFIWRDPVLEHSELAIQTPSKYTRPAPTRSLTYQASEPSSSFRSSGLQRSRTEPVESMSSKGIFGIVLGAAAGAAVGYAMIRSENDDGGRGNANGEWRGRQGEKHERTSRRSMSAASGSVSDRRSSGRRTAPEVVRAIDSRPYRDDENISYIRTRVTQQSDGRSKGFESVKIGPSRFSTKRSATMPVERADDRSRYSDRRDSVPDDRSRRRDSVVGGESGRSHRSHASKTKSSTSQVSTVKPARREIYAEPAQIPLPPSVASKATSRASTVRPAKRESAHYNEAAQMPLPPSVVSRGSKKPSAPRFDAYYLPSDEDDGLGDTATIVPDDSISCVDIPRARRKDSSRGSRVDKAESLMTIPIRSGRDEMMRSRMAFSDAR